MFVSETKPNTIQTISNYSCLSICGPLHTFTSTRFHITCLQNQNGIGRKKYRFVHRPFCTNQVPLDILRFVQDRVVIRHKIKGFTVGQLKIFLEWFHWKPLILCRIGSWFGTKWTSHWDFNFVKNRACTNHSLTNCFSNCCTISFLPTILASCQAMGGPKRKAPSTGTAGSKAKASKKGNNATLSVPPDAMKLPHLRIYDDWAHLFSK